MEKIQGKFWKLQLSASLEKIANLLRPKKRKETYVSRENMERKMEQENTLRYLGPEYRESSWVKWITIPQRGKEAEDRKKLHKFLYDERS